MSDFQLKPIDLKNNSEICVSFRADSFKISFLSDREFWTRYGLQGEKYLALLSSKERIEGFHLWSQDQITGQVELGMKGSSTSLHGHVYLYSLVSEMRGKGLGKILDDFSIRYFQEKGASKVTLTVSLINRSAVRFYEKQGWKNIGVNEVEAQQSQTGLSVYYMERDLMPL